MSGQKGTLIFIVPNGLDFPTLMRSGETGKVRLLRLPRIQIENANPGVDWAARGMTLIFVMAWYEMLRAEGFHDPVAESIRVQTTAPILLRCSRLVPETHHLLLIH